MTAKRKPKTKAKHFTSNQETNMEQLPTLLARFGNVEVYYFDNPHQPGVYMPTEVYWALSGSPKSYGPFKSANEAVFHYETMVAAQKAVPTVAEQTPGKVIFVDFVNKVREK